MKKIALLFLLCSALMTQAQIIQNVSVLPANPTEDDVVSIVVQSAFTSGGCEMISHTANVVGSSIDLQLYHCLGILTVICYSSDTIVLGQLPAGSYVLSANVWYGAGMPDCTTFQPGDSAIQSFIVDFSNSIRSNLDSKPMVIVKDRSLLIDKVPSESIVELVDINGRILRSAVLSASGNLIDLHDLSGMCFYRIRSKEGRMATGKLFFGQ